MEQYIFAPTACEAGLEEELAAALEKRTEIFSRASLPGMWKKTDALYSGGAVRVNNVWTSVAGEIDCCEVRYDRKTEKLKLRIVEPPREKKAQPKVAPRKPARGPKL